MNIEHSSLNIEHSRSPLSLLLFSLLLFSLPILAAERPNVLFIFMDDYGWKDTSYGGSDFYETPNVDALARGGMVFDNAYSAAANCAPARACLLSGQYTPRHQLFNVGTRPRGNAKHRRLDHVPGVDVLNPKLQTWAHRIQKAGYATATIGKWHLSNDPLPYGFDVNVGGTHSGSPPRGYYPPHPGAPGLQDVPKDEYLTDTLTHRAVDFIRTNKDKPWCLYLTHFTVHTPIQAPRELVAKYKQKKPGALHSHAVMAAMIESYDTGVGQIVATLESLNLRDNTVIIFFSDNGGYGPATSMAPLKGYKGTYYEGGIRVPFFVNWPGKVKSGTTSSEPIIGVDLFPTLCELTGAELPANQPLDGTSLVPIFTGKTETLDREAIYWHFPAYLQSYNGVKNEAANQRDVLFRSRPCGIIRVGNYKLHEYFETGELELYDLSADLGETTNLADRLPEKAAELHRLLKTWRQQTNAPVPTAKNPDFDPAAETSAIAKRLKKAK